MKGSRAKWSRRWLYDLAKVCGLERHLIAIAAQDVNFFEHWPKMKHPQTMIELVIHWRSCLKVRPGFDRGDPPVVRSAQEWDDIVACLDDCLAAAKCKNRERDEYVNKAVDMQLCGRASRIVGDAIRAGVTRTCPPGGYVACEAKWNRKMCNIIRKHFPKG